MELLRASNKPENIKGIAEKGYAVDYVNYLISVGDELPEVLVDWLGQNGNPSKLGICKWRKTIDHATKPIEREPATVSSIRLNSWPYCVASSPLPYTLPSVAPT